MTMATIFLFFPGSKTPLKNYRPSAPLHYDIKAVDAHFWVKSQFSGTYITAQGAEGAFRKPHKNARAATKVPSIVASAIELRRKLVQTRRFFYK
jgi:hypothetical protein